MKKKGGPKTEIYISTFRKASLLLTLGCPPILPSVFALATFAILSFSLPLASQPVPFHFLFYNLIQLHLDGAGTEIHHCSLCCQSKYELCLSSSLRLSLHLNLSPLRGLSETMLRTAVVIYMDIVQ